MKTSLPADATREILSRLARANGELSRAFPGDSAARQPVHVMYGGAQLFRSDSAPRMGARALAALAEHAPDAAAFAKALGVEPGPFQERVHALVMRKLETEPVEDFRIDFEDGYGNRPNAEEDGHAVSVAFEVAKGRDAGTLPAFLGIRIKPFTEELRDRSIRTLDLFLTTLVEAGGLPPGFVVTLPKVTVPGQVAAMADLCDLLEPRLGLAAGALRFEIMVETPQAIVGADGRVVLPELIRAGRGRCVSTHFGTYDYTAGVNVTAAHQRMDHPACDFAKAVMQVALAGTGVTMSDGATNVLPVGSREAVHAAWRLHYGHVRHSLVGGFYQGWDLHPAQLPTRFAAVYAFFLESLPAAKERLANFVAKAAQATIVGDVFDDAATGQGLLNYFLRGIACGAIAEEEVLATGITLEELRGRSFVKILKSRLAGPRVR